MVSGVSQRFRRPLDKRAQLRYNASEKAALRRIAAAAAELVRQRGWRWPDPWNLLTDVERELAEAIQDHASNFGTTGNRRPN